MTAVKKTSKDTENKVTAAKGAAAKGRAAVKGGTAEKENKVAKESTAAKGSAKKAAAAGQAVVEAAERAAAKTAKKAASAGQAVVKTAEKAAAKQAAKSAQAGRKKTVRKPAKTVILQYAGKEVDEAEVTERALAQFAAVEGSVSVRNITLYLKPEDNAVYYVINGQYTGRVDI